MPFTAQQFFETFAKYNTGVWPAQVVLTALALSVIVLLIRTRPTHRRWIAADPAVPTFGLPCPTTIFTIGVLLFAKAPVPRSAFIVPVLWALVGSTAAFTL